MKREKNIKHPPVTIVCSCGEKWCPYLPETYDAHLEHMREYAYERESHIWAAVPIMGNQ